MYPFPCVRDNMTKRHDFFNHADLLNNLFGYTFTNHTCSGPAHDTAFLPSTYTWPVTLICSIVSDNGEDDLFARRNSLMVWGEPWDMESWEARPGFIRKWLWL